MMQMSGGGGCGVGFYFFTLWLLFLSLWSGGDSGHSGLERTTAGEFLVCCCA